MSAFAGIVSFHAASADGQAADRLGRAITVLNKGRPKIQRLEGASFAYRPAIAAHGATAGDDECPLASKNGRALFAAVARLDNRDELGAALAIAPAQLARISDSILILRMLERWGDAGIARCLGAFAFAYWDADQRRLILGRDCLGNRTLFFTRAGDFVAFASTLNTLLALPGVPKEIDDIVLADYLALNLGEARRTFYRGIDRVPTRTIVTISQDRVEHRYYWSPDLTAPQPYKRDEDYIARARELLDQAVAAATDDTKDVAISASGGFDSSAIAATAARLGRAARITCYTLVPPPGMRVDVGPFKYSDERDKMQALSRMHRTLNLRFIAPEKPHGYEDDATRYFARTNLPALNPSNLGWFTSLFDAALADGCRVVLTGNRGNLGLTWRGRFSLLALLRGRRLDAFLNELAAVARVSNRSLPRTLASDVLITAAPTWLRRLIYRVTGRDPDSVARYSALNPAFIADHGLDRKWQAEGFDPWFKGFDWNAPRFRAHHLFDHNQFARDTAAMRIEQHGFETRDPLGDRRLLEFLLTVPEPLYCREGIPRSFARAVLADRLPREILDERRTGAQSGAWFDRLTTQRRNLSEAIEGLETSPLARRLIDVPRLKRLMSEWPRDENAAELVRREYHLLLDRGIHVGRFIRWVEGGNA